MLVTGGSSGIGLALARAYRSSGAEVTITGRRTQPEDYEVDLSGLDYRQCEMADSQALDRLASSFDRLDVLVNNAGHSLVADDEWQLQTFQKSLTTNLTSAFQLSTACHDLLAASGLDGGAAVLNIASMASYFGMGLIPGYGASKAGLVQLTKTLAVQWAADGIRVNAIAPGLTHSAMTARMAAIPEADRAAMERTPMRRWADADADIAPVALFLTGAGARFITGQCLPVDGGFTAQG